MEIKSKKTTVFIDGDFPSGKGDCEHHCSPTCHPGQVNFDKWMYGCLHKAWPQNKYGDFCPLVDCDGKISKCEFKKPSAKKMVSYYLRGKKLSLKYVKEKMERLTKEIEEIEKLTKDA